MLNICLVSEEYPEETNFGGIATYQKRMAKALQQLGNNVIVISRALKEERMYVEDNITVYRIKQIDDKNAFNRYVDYRKRVKELLIKLVDEKKIDIIETSDWGAEAIFYMSERKVPIVVKLHTPLCIWSEVNQSKLEGQLHDNMLQWEKESIENADKIISCTEMLKKLVIEKINLYGKDIDVIYNPGNMDDFYCINESSHKTKNILFCGSLEQRKGVITFAKMIKIVMNVLRDNEIKFVFAGKDTKRNDKNISMIEYIKEIVPKEYHNNLEFLGQIENSKLNKIYNDSRIGIVPSVFDNLPYVAMEMMLSELPVIASMNTGVTEMVTDQISGMFFNPLDELELAKKVVYLYQNESLALEMGKKARIQALDKYNPISIAKVMEKIYLETIRGYNEKI